ncbi:sensor domain-containing protein [Leptonema illini]|uniref:Diguanylate cyclase with PAS/PAC sensor n=1 Tax=Leptonema illini DSM 21528 TaxID=929563 RepID=H2CFE8_9LEPT|nr:sensor domain-containing diguanylate cyclase [Leptonema illini]EHQ07773.1 diguanylate cyclase with PAS/PAC sensor [Leptonema illini DSM 21528]
MRESLQELRSLLIRMSQAADTGASFPAESEDLLAEVIDSATRIKRAIAASKNRRYSQMDDRYKQAIHQALIRQSLMGIALIEEERFVFTNHRFCQIFGYTPEELQRLSPMDLAAPEDREIVASNLRRRRPLKNERVSYQARGIHKDGTELTVEIFGSAAAVDGTMIPIVVVEDVTEREKARRDLRESELRMRGIFDNSLVGIVIAQMRNGHIEEVNDHFLQLSGFSREEMIGHTTVELGVWAIPEQRDEMIAHLRKGESLHGFHATLRKKNGELRELLLSARAASLHGIECSVVSTMDITELLKAREDLERQRGRMQAVINLHPSGIALFDSDRRLILWNKRYEELLQYPDHFLKRNDILFDDVVRFNHARGDYPGLTEQEALDFFLEKLEKARTVHLARQHRGDHIFEIDGIPLPGEEALIIYTDITDLSHAEEEMRILANHDPLTHLPNRRQLMDALHAMLSGKRERHTAILLLDLDDFKPLNDRFGHQTGDVFLVEIADRLRRTVRSSDIVARIGGDEFVVLLTGLDPHREQALKEATGIAEKIRSAIGLPYSLTLTDEQAARRYEHACSCSIGIRLLRNETDADMVIQQADTAMYSAKRAGKNQIAFYGGP